MEGIDSAALHSPVRVAIVVSHPIQYFAPWYRRLSSLHGISLKVFFCCKWGAEAYYDRDFHSDVKWDIPLLDGYEWEILDGSHKIRSEGFWAVDNPNVDASLARFNPDVITVHGYAHRTMWRVAEWSRRNNIPVMLYSDSNGAARRALWKRAVKKLVVKRFYRYMDGAFASGDNNREYHHQFGLPIDRVFSGSMPIDRQRLLASVGDRAIARRKIRQRHGIPKDAFVVVYAGKFIPLKCVPHLLKAIDRCRQMGIEIWALLVGNGPERPAIERLISTLRLKTVVLAGFVNQSAIAEYYAASEVVALMSSREAKGLPVPEAGCFGCPAILSDRVGCIGPTDSARPGQNALVYPWSNIAELTSKLTLLSKDRKLYHSMSEAAETIATSQDITVAAFQFLQAATRIKRMGCRN